MAGAKRYAVETEFTIADSASKVLDRIGKGAGALGASFDKAQGRWNALGAKLTQTAQVFGAAALGAAAAAGRKYVEFEDVLTKAGSKFTDLDVTGATYAEDLDALSKAAQKVGATTKYSASDAAGALDKMAMAGLTSRQSMALLMGTTNLATAAGIDLTGAVDMATDSLGMFGMMKDAAGNPLDEAGLEASMNRIADVVAKTTNMANLDMPMWFEAAKQGASAFTSFGGSIEEFSAVAGILANDGIKGSAGGTAIRNIMLGMAGTTGPAKKALAALGVDVYDAEGKMRPFASLIEQLSAGLSGLGDEDKAAYLSDLFGKENISPALMLVSEGADKIREYTDALRAAGGTASTIARAQEKSLAGQLASLSSAMEAKQLQFGEALKNAGGLRVLERFISFVQNLDLSPLIGVFSAAFEKIGEIVMTTAEYLGEYTDFGGKMNLGAVAESIRSMDVIPIVRALGDMIAHLKSIAGFLVNHAGLVALAAKAWGAYQIAMMALVPVVRGAQLAGSLGGIGKAALGAGQAMSAGLRIASLSARGMGGAAAFMAAEAGTGARLFAKFLTPVLGAFRSLGTLALSAGHAVAGAVSAAGSAIASFFSATVVPLLMNPVTWIAAGIAALAALVVACVAHWETWGRTVSGAVGIVVPGLNVIMGIVHSVADRWDGIAASFRDGGILAGLSAIGGAIKAGIFDALSSTVELLRKIPVVGAPLSAIFEGFARNWELFFSAVDNVKKAFSDGGFVAGIAAIGGAILSAILSPVEAVLSALSHIPGIGRWIEPATEAISRFRDTLSGFGAGNGEFVTKMPAGSEGSFSPTMTSARAEQYSREESVTRSEVELKLAAGLEPSGAVSAPGITVSRRHSGSF